MFFGVAKALSLGMWRVFPALLLFNLKCIVVAHLDNCHICSHLVPLSENVVDSLFREFTNSEC